MDFGDKKTKNMDNEFISRLVNNYISRLVANKINIKEVYLFGSIAKNTGQEYSDVDLAIIVDKFKNRFNFEIQLMSLRNDDETIIEPHVFLKDEFNETDPFVHEIVKTGKKIIF